MKMGFATTTDLQVSRDTVLVADSDPQMRRWLRQAFESHGHDVQEAAHGCAALDLAERIHPRVIVTDILLPCRSGFELITRLRQAASRARIIAITGVEGDSGMVILDTARTLGADAALNKPFSISQLMSVSGHGPSLGSVVPARPE